MKHHMEQPQDRPTTGFRIEIPEGTDADEVYAQVTSLVDEINGRGSTADPIEMMRRTIEIEAFVRYLGCKMEMA